MRTIEWDAQYNRLRMIDQRILPAKFEVVVFNDYRQVAEAIRNMTVRGAPAIGASAAFAMALAACRSLAVTRAELRAELVLAGTDLCMARPTAVNLAWAVQRMLDFESTIPGDVHAGRDALIAEAQHIADEDVETNLRMARCGAELIQDGDTIIHHCNTGALATVDWGTALGVIRMAHQMGKSIHVLVDETRPRLQGARLTAWELSQYGISYEIISDGAAGYLLRSGEAQKVFFGADRVAANGDVANKIGTYMLSLAAYSNGVPAYSVFPTSTVDLALPNGDLIPIEMRDPAEVLDIQLAGAAVMPNGARARNPAFDITPHYLISALVTEKGIVYPPFHSELPRIMSLQS
jgi:methylthioribose-1-phosphate isomerase